MPEAGVLPSSVFDAPEALAARLDARPFLVFLDFDGTLCPIVPRPEDAVLDADMRVALAALAARHPVGVVSGRALADLRARVGLEGLYYAGNHGFEWTAPPDPAVHREAGEAYVAAVAEMAAQLESVLPAVDGLQVEDKLYSLSIHYRRVAPAHVDAIVAAVRAAAAGHPELKVRGGKCVVEVLPRLDWHKGKAVRRLAASVGLPGAVPLFVGDDVTDEDAFRELAGDGVGIVVCDPPRPSAARYRVRDVAEVARLLRWLGERSGP